MRRGTAQGKFVGIVQVSVASLEGVIADHILQSYSDGTHVVLKAHSYFKKLPLHNGSRFSELMDLKLIGISESEQYAPRESDPYIGYDDDGEVVGTDFYKSTIPPTTVIRHNIAADSPGDKIVYLFVPRSFSEPLSFASETYRAVRFYLSADFSDGSTVPVLMEIKRLPIVTVAFDDIDSIQIGNNTGTAVPGFPMTVGVNLGDSAQTVEFDSNVTLKTLYSFGKWSANNRDQNADLVRIYGSGNYFIPWALPAFRVAYTNTTTSAITATATWRRSSDNKNLNMLRWVTGTTKHISYGWSSDNLLTNEEPDSGLICLGRFFRMDRIDGITDTPGGGASNNTGTAGMLANSGGISYGRRFGGINYFSKNEAAEGVTGFYETYPTNADGTADESGPNGSRIGLGPTMGFTLNSFDTSVTFGGTVTTEVNDLQASGTNGASMLFAPSTYTHQGYVFNKYTTSSISDMDDITHPSGARGIASWTNTDVFGRSNESELAPSPGYTYQSMTCIKDIKCNFFDQAQDYKAGAPMIVTARQLALSEDYSEADLDTQAYQMFAGPSLSDIATNSAVYSTFTLENDPQEMFFSRSNFYSEDHRGAYSIMFNRDYYSKPHIQPNSGIGSFYLTNDGNTGNKFFPEYEESKIFRGHFASGLELFANYMMGGTGSIGIPQITADKGKYYEGQPDKLYPTGIASAMSALSLVDPTSAAFSTNVAHDGSVLYAQNGGGFFPLKFGEADATSAGDTTGRKRIGIAGYQDVVFIVAMGNTAKNGFTPVTSGANNEWSRNIPWIGTDCAMAMHPSTPYSMNDGNTGGNFGQCGGITGTYYVAPFGEEGCTDPNTAGPINARMFSYRNQGARYLFGTVTGVYSPIQAFSPSNTTMCTDPVFEDGRTNFEGGSTTTGLTITGGGNSYPSQALSNITNALPAQFMFNGTPGPMGDAQQNCSQLYGNVLPKELQVEITDDAGGFGYNETQNEFGFQGLRVKACLTYTNYNAGTGADNFATASGSKTTSIKSEALSIWNVKLTPGNAFRDNGLFNYAQTVFPNEDSDDIEHATITSLGALDYSLNLTFRNSENVLSFSEIPQLFPDLPFKRALPQKSAGGMKFSYAQTLYGGGGTSDANRDNSLDSILSDSYRSSFFNVQYGAPVDKAAHAGRVKQYHGTDFGEAYFAATYYAPDTTKLRISPVSTLYDKTFVSTFVTYGKFDGQSGCTDATAINFDPDAIVDDGSCVEAVPGCTDPAATNYNADANTDDGGCEYCTGYFQSYTSNTVSDYNNVAISALLNGSSSTTPLINSAGMKFGSWVADNNGMVGAELGISDDNRVSSYLPSSTFQNVFQGIPSAADAPWIDSIQKVGMFIPPSNIAFDPVTQNIGISMVLGDPFISGLSDAALEVIENPNMHRVNVYLATDDIISAIMDANSNTGEGGDVTSSKINPFVTETENGVYGYNSSTSQSFLQASGHTQTFTTGATGVFGTSANENTRVVQFKFTGPGSNVPVAINNSTLYVVEYLFTDRNCPDTAKWTSFYGFFMIGTCGCTTFGNQNAPSLYSWQTSGVSTLPVAYDSIPNCVNNFVLNAPVAGEGDQSTSLCFTPDEELSSCNTLYQQCILNPETICIEEATGIDDPDLIYVGGNYYYPQETTVTVRADGIWNPTTNQYQVNNYLSYTVTPVIDGISQPSLAQTHLEGETQFEAATNTPVGITHDFTFGTVSSYSFIIEYQNPIGETIYQDLTGLGPTCTVQLPTIDVENTCLVLTGCTDPDATNFDENATFDDGSCEYQDCELIFLEAAGGFTSTDITATNASSSCETQTVTVLGQTIETSYVNVNADGTINVKVIVDTAVEEFPATQCYIVITPAATSGLVGVGSASDLLDIIIQNWATTSEDGGFIDLGNEGYAQISKLQNIDVDYSAVSGNATDLVNRDYDGSTSSTTGYTFDDLYQGTYFIFIIPPPDLLDGLTEFYAANCSEQTIYFQDEITTASVNIDLPSEGACLEDCNNPLGCEQEVYGCTDPDNTNYNPDATLDDGSCEPDPACPPGSTDPACIDCSTEFAQRLLGGNIKRRIDDGAEDPCDPTAEGEGCTDPNACNYDPYIDTSNTNNQLCDYCSCQPDSIDCCDGEDCGGDDIDDVIPECPDPNNPDCDVDPPQPCYDPADCPPPPEPCVILGTCDPDPTGPGDNEDNPIIEVVNPVSVTCVPDFVNAELWSEVQYAAMQCASNEGAKMVIKMKHGIEFDEEDLIKLDLITYLFKGGADGSELPCLFNCNYSTKTRFDKYNSQEKWAQGGGIRWTSTERYKKGQVVAYFYNQRGTTYISYFSAMRNIAPGELHPKYKDSPWKQVIDRKPKTVDPLGIANGTETYLEDLYNYFVRFCTSCTVSQNDGGGVIDDGNGGTVTGGPTGGGGGGQVNNNTNIDVYEHGGEGPNTITGTGPGKYDRNPTGISKKKTTRSNNRTGIIGPDGEEIIF